MGEREPGGISGLEHSSRVELGDKPTEAVTDSFVYQLKRFIILRRRADEEELNPLGIRLLDKIIVARIRDLNGLGCREQVSQIINPPETPKG